MSSDSGNPGRKSGKPFIRGALANSLKVRGVGEIESEGLADGLEASGRAALVLDESGAVVYRTSSIRALVGHDFKIAGGRLQGLDSTAESAFREIAAWARGESDCRLAGFVIPRASAEKKSLIALPIRRIEHQTSPTAARSVVAFIDLSHAQPSPTEHLRTLFHLTQSEAEVAAHIAAGLTVTETASLRRVAPATIRAQLKSIFRKLDLNRQSDIVRLVDRIGWTSPKRPRRGQNR